MTGDLLINGKDAYNIWGVDMGDNFLDALGASSPMKEYIQNESRLEHGKRVITSNAKIDYRELTLSFTITGDSQPDFQLKKKAFYNELYKGSVVIKIPKVNNEVFYLNYLGKSITYAQSIDRTFGKISSKFEEPNPTKRD
ncbi:hypothetical protein [Bacteroides sp.]|uniref:hypothetical protein n=1 Tax=Bacteroides sp. TaxID=29523 RepID=UPI0026340E52|nr:hypothetical protein [Bacteroides sp.]MDD3038604.1 hypothetical protein [Bacteroides sp.]